MMFNKLTFNLALGILVIVAIYTLTYSGLTGLLMTSAVSLLAAAFLDDVELIAVVAVVFAVLFTTFSKQILRKLEGFANQDKEILERVQGMKANYKPVAQNLHNPRMEPAGVYEPSIEGFANASDMPNDEDGAPSKSGAASTKSSSKNSVNDMEVKKISKNIKDKDDAKSKDSEIEGEEFQSATNGLFKLGKMPSEHAEGPKLDAGKTIMKAMSSFDPKTISAMTDDTKKLLETQKGLMSMLNEMRPVLADGKELLNTFSGMFGGSGGSGLLKM
uniref:Uncharacterized protein n=1 Tax=viral metagenome TaxID=1070528 RepID=A0A6C0KVZ5_9ZZZZ